MPHRAEQNRRISLQFLENGFGQNLAGSQIAFAAQVEILGLQRDALRLADCFEHFQAFRRHFRPRPVAAHHRHPQFLIVAHFQFLFGIEDYFFT